MTVKNADTDSIPPETDDARSGQDHGDAEAGPAERPSSASGTPGEQTGDDNDADSASAGDEDLAVALVDAREELQKMKDGFLRAQAEVENIRRRSQNEIQSARKYAVEGFAQELLSVKDSLDQAAQVELSDAAGEAVVRMKEGLELTLRQLETALSKFAVEEVEAAPGVRFNPDHHQAISMVSSEEIPSDHIVSVMQKGFLLKDRLLRPAMVVVAS